MLVGYKIYSLILIGDYLKLEVVVERTSEIVGDYQTVVFYYSCLEYTGAILCRFLCIVTDDNHTERAYLLEVSVGIIVTVGIIPGTRLSLQAVE